MCIRDRLTAPRESAPKTKEQKRREAEARNRAYAALKNHRKRIAELDRQMERDNARMAELLDVYKRQGQPRPSSHSRHARAACS